MPSYALLMQPRMASLSPMTNTNSPLLSLLVALASACTITSHPTERAKLGVARDSDALLAQIDQPGPLEVETVVSSDWSISRAGLINLDHEHAKSAQLSDGDEPIKVFFHVVKHPQHGTFLVDTGVENALRDAPDDAVLHGVLASAMGAEKMKIQAPLGAWLRQHDVQLKGVLLTHLHLDHVLGLPDVPRGTPLYVGPHESSPRAFMNVLAQPLTDELLAGHAPLQELSFPRDERGRFAGVLDLFGDGSLWAIHTPGHTPGSMAFVARTAQGPVLLTGDTSHTKWGWDNDVEPGSFTSDHESNRRSLAQLRTLAKQHKLDVRLGHQAL